MLRKITLRISPQFRLQLLINTGKLRSSPSPTPGVEGNPAAGSFGTLR
jgi:hypothetical protein